MQKIFKNWKNILVISFCLLSLNFISMTSGNDKISSEMAAAYLENFTPPMVDPSDLSDYTQPRANQEPTIADKMDFAKEMSLYVLGFGLVLSIFTGIIALRTKGWNREATNVFTVTIIITAGLFLMTAGYSSEQIAPMYGLLGTVVGYLLGKTRSTDAKNEEKQD